MPALILKVVWFLYTICGFACFFYAMLKRGRDNKTALEFANEEAHKDDAIRIMGWERIAVVLGILIIFVLCATAWPAMLIVANMRKKK